MVRSQPGEAGLFQPIDLRGVKARNRVVISSMCLYSAVDGEANDFHFAHLARFATGGAGVVFMEATAVTADGRISYDDTGLYDDSQIAPLRRITAFLQQQGAIPAIQLAHAGRKSSGHAPWNGSGPLDQASGLNGLPPWEISAPSAIPAEGWPSPRR